MGNITVIYIVLRLLTYFTLLVAKESSNCTQRDTTLLICANGTVPAILPDNVTHVILDGINFDYFDRGQFSDSSWINIIRLEVNAPTGLNLKSDVFYGLNNLYHLKVTGTELYYLQGGSFRWLPKVEKLDLSDNVRLGLVDVLITLQDGVNVTLPSLRWLNLARLQTYYSTPIELSAESDAFGILGRRKIEYLDFSGCTISPLDLNEMEKMCTNLRQFILRETIITNPMLTTVYLCASLVELDLSHSQSIDLSTGLKFTTIFPFSRRWLQNVLRMFLNVENALFSHLRSKVPIDFQQTLRLSNVPLRLKKIDLSFNSIKIFNGSVLLHPVTAKTIREINFSNNIIEYMSPNILSASLHNEILNLSNNSLDKMASHYTCEFEHLLRNLTHLRILDMSGNHLKTLPRAFFLYNHHLLELDLSHNSLQGLNFKLNHLKRLRTLDLCGNNLKMLDSHAIWQFEEIGKIQSLQRTKDNETDVNDRFLPKVFLHENPIECGCDKKSVKSFKWIARAVYVVRADTLTCSFQDKSFAISDATLDEVLNECYTIEMRKILLICGPVVAFIISICILLTVVARRYINRRNSMKEFVQVIKSNGKLKYLIFLSFCNEDGDLVLEKIYPRMRDEVSRALDCDRNLVCCGELNFRPGMSVCLEVMRCVEQSAVVIFVVSKTFCQKSWCKMEVDTANAQRKPVVLLFLEKVEPELMTPYIQKLFNRYSRASWNCEKGGDELRPSWSVLISSVIELGCTFHTQNKPMKGVEKIDLSCGDGKE